MQLGNFQQNIAEHIHLQLLSKGALVIVFELLCLDRADDKE